MFFSPASVGFFIRKKDGSLKACIDYQGLNKTTVKNRFPPLLISELLDHVNGAWYFSNLNLGGVHTLIRSKRGRV